MNKMSFSLKQYGSKKILIIDDDSDILFSFQCAFEMEGYEVRIAKNGQEAFDLLGSLKDSELPDIIMLDYSMPIMDGKHFSLAKATIPRLAQIPVVLMTASGEINRIFRSMDAAAYLDKPLDLDQMMKVVFNFVHRANDSRGCFLA